ncbi:MAG: beta galactosidase jelly roll domain-containing protein [Candidatus Heimdallarchaeota archaeon]|nr:MAG: beta galactosidase jelly roll domain-containing protein [Candidatus Heimdallarchaeota archaeon]
MSNKKPLNKEWKMQSSEKVSKYGEKISTADFNPEDWYTVDVPSTVVNGLVINGEFQFKDPYFGLNLKSLPGYKKDVQQQQNFESRYKPEDSPYRKSWWFRKEFLLDEGQTKNEYWIVFNGINYSANIWLNGKRIAGSDYVIGTYRRYDFHVTHFLNHSGKNVLALEVFSPNPDDLGISFVDWCPLPPDDNMGIWQPIFLYTTGPVVMKNVFIQSKLNVSTLTEAKVLISAELTNTQKDPINAVLEGTIENITFKKEIKLSSFQKEIIEISSEDFPNLRINNPRVWWPYQLGSPELYELDIQVKVNNQISDSKKVTFGIRDVKTSINEYGSRVFTINGHDILMRGAAWTPDMMLRQSKLEDEISIDFLRNLNMNIVRLEGKLATDHFWDECDKKGMLVLAGWVCCSHWEKWKKWKSGDIQVAKESLLSQLLRLRNHPSLVAWFYGSDFPPPKPVEEVYLNVLKETYDDLPRISSATAQPSELLGETGVKMTGPYTYVPPIYWYSEGRPGAAYGFNTETGPDTCIPPLESIERFLPEDQHVVGSEAWNHHAGLGAFSSTKIVEDAITERYGEQKGIESFVRTTQVLGYECWRAMYEAHARNFPKATGVIGWMLNSPWPSLIWQLYDYYNNPNGAFFGSKKACEPLHVQYSYDDASIWVINSALAKKENLAITVRVLNIDLETKFSQTWSKIDIDPNNKKKIFDLPRIEGLSSVFFIDLTLKDDSIMIIKNTYWLSTKKDIFEEKDEWFYTPLKSHADMRELFSLPRAKINHSSNIKENDNHYEIIVDVENISEYLAFFLRFLITDSSTGKYVSPIYWNDNCISLFPTEKVEIKGIIPKHALKGKAIVKIDGWNC